MPVPTSGFGVVAEREVYVVKEAAPGVIPASIGVPVPVTSFKPSNKPLWMKDESEQGHMEANSGIYQGPLIAGFDIGGHVTGDVFPHFLYNMCGDYTTTGTAATPSGTTNASVAVGALALPVAAGGASFTSGMYVWIEDSGSPAASEVCLVGTGSTGTSVVLATPGTRFAHATATPFTNTAAPYTHVFATLVGLVGAWNGPAQPPTHCITDRQGVAANGAEQYAYACMSEITIMGNAEKLLDWTGKAVCASRVTAGSAVGTTNVSSVTPYPSWRSAVGVGGVASGGTQVKNIAEWSLTLGREVKAYNANQGSQQPYVISRGKRTTTGKNVVAPAIDDSNLIAVLANTQPQLQYVASNGLTGSSLVSVQIDIVLTALLEAGITDNGPLFGFDVPYEAVGTALTGASSITTTGASGGKGSVKVTVVNAVPLY